MIPLNGALALTGLMFLIPGAGRALWHIVGDEPQPWWTKSCMLTGVGFLAAAVWASVPV